MGDVASLARVEAGSLRAYAFYHPVPGGMTIEASNAIRYNKRAKLNHFPGGKHA
jgi:hypothetical protein